MSEAKTTVQRLADEISSLEARLQVDDECMAHLCKMYTIIWPEACYDSLNESTEKFARSLLPHIKALNKRLHFKK